MTAMKSVFSRKVIFPEPKLKVALTKEFGVDVIYSSIAKTLKNSKVRLSNIKYIHVSLIFKRKGYYYLRLTVTDKDDRKGYKTMSVGEVRKNIIERLRDWLLP